MFGLDTILFQAKYTVIKRQVKDSVYTSSSHYMWDPTVEKYSISYTIVKLYMVCGR